MKLTFWTWDEYRTAYKEAEELGVFNNSITSGGGTLASILGEVKAAEYLGAKRENTYDYDLVWNGLKIDVKTKKTTVKIVKLNYEASIADFNTTQECDMYLFTRVNMITQQVWVIGMIDRDEYYEKARFMKKGTVDPSNNYTVKADCYNLPYSELLQLE